MTEKENPSSSPLYCDYDSEHIAGSYDKTRFISGFDFIKHAIGKYLATKNIEPVVGDFPCGSGNYSAKLAANGASLLLCDLSEDMLKIAQSKIPKDQIVGSYCVDLRDMKGKVQDELVNCITCNQFYHHVIKKKGDTSRIEQVFKEFNRVLTRDGIFILNFCTVEQVKFSFWTRQLFPEDVLEKELDHYLTETEMKELIERCGFEFVESVPCKEQLQPDIDNLDYRRPEVRKGDSGFVNFGKEEIVHWVEKLDELMKKNDPLLEEYKQISRKFTEEKGCCQFFVCKKK